MPELKPCPFCGGEAKTILVIAPFIKKEYRGRVVAAGCPKCGITTPLIEANNKTGSPLINKAHENAAMEKAAEIWNRRTNNGEIQKETR